VLPLRITLQKEKRNKIIHQKVVPTRDRNRCWN
jgi:hypothetical protein